MTTPVPLRLGVDLGIAAHEMRTPLTAITAAGELLLDSSGSESSEVRRFAQLVVRNADRLRLLIDDLVLLAEVDQQTEPAARSVAVEELLNKAASPWLASTAEHGAALTTTCGDGPPLSGHQPLLLEALRRVIGNAVEVTPAAGVVEIVATYSGAEWRIDVADGGSTVPATQFDRVFDPFFDIGGVDRRKGLGLAIAAAIVRRHGGTVAAGARSGSGLTVNLVLPSAAHSRGEPCTGS